MRNQAIVVTIFLIIHHAVAVMHGGVHTEIPVILSSFQNFFVTVVMLLLPLVAVILAWTRYAKMGLLLLAVCMAGSLFFDVYHHYILVSPDNIAHLPDAPDHVHSRFVWTAHALTMLQLIGTGLALYFWRTRSASS